VPTDDRLLLRPDCSSCVGLCCVALPFERSAEFAVDKPAGVPCVHLQDDDRCEIHSRLRESGFPGCTVFDCLGAGQQVTQVTFGGASWRDGDATAGTMFPAFRSMRGLHELRWYLAEAGARTAAIPSAAALALRVEGVAVRVRALADADAGTLAALDLDDLRAEVGVLLTAVSAAVRGSGSGGPGADLAHTDLVGQDLRQRDLVRADLRGALLLGADLRGVDLTHVDLLGADLRAADVRGANLSDALFLTAPQVAAARGDAKTRLPEVVPQPGHWSGAATGSTGGRRSGLLRISRRDPRHR
jgi:uncharacterized protein YjbI with pentapeptide repeats